MSLSFAYCSVSQRTITTAGLKPLPTTRPSLAAIHPVVRPSLSYASTVRGTSGFCTRARTHQRAVLDWRQKRAAISCASTTGGEPAETLPRTDDAEPDAREFMRDTFKLTESQIQRSMDFLATEQRRFYVSKARETLETMRIEHEKNFPFVPFGMPKTWPGMRLVLLRCSSPL
mmetsp:Transcript_2210/g.7914  ORF Transcript_2210/g.7914 Transcript_2210/m.7914 type:complete len:173 (+) Transcript_2210:118-636(+)